MAKNKSKFEDDLNRLNEIVESLDKADTPIEEMLKLYEEGIILVKNLKAFLKNAELKIIELNRSGEIKP